MSSPLEVGADRSARVLAEVSDALRAAGCDVAYAGAVNTPDDAVRAGVALAGLRPDAIVAVPACWFEDYLAIDMIEECGAPILFWPQPGMETGALCGAQQTAAMLGAMKHPCSLVFGTAGDVSCRVDAIRFLRACALRSRLRRARIGLLGRRVNGMTHTAANEYLLKKSMGPRLVHLDPSILGPQPGAAGGEAPVRLWRDLRARAGQCDVTDADGEAAMRAYCALRAAVGEHGLSAVAVGCYPALMGKVCLAATLLSDEGIPMACEGDVHGAVGQLMLTLLTRQPTHHTDWLDPVDPESVVFTHCGSGSWSLAEKPEAVHLAPVRLMSQGVCSLFTARSGPVTLVNVSPSVSGYQVAAIEAVAVHTEMVFPGNPVRVRFGKPVKEIMAWGHANGLGHHWMIGYGSVANEIRAWGGMAGEGVRVLSI